MRKYLSVFKITWQDALEYRTEFFISLGGWVVRLMISLFLFMAIFQEKATIGGFDIKETILYFIIIQVLLTLIFSRIGFNIGIDIQKGDLSNYLVKPISYIAFQIIRQLSRNLMQVMIAMIIYTIVFLAYDPSFFARITVSQISLAMIGLFFAYILNITMVMSIGLTAFWITNSSRLIYMFYSILSIFSGLMIPINFFPEKAQEILFNTPFPYIFYVPTQLILGNIKGDEYLSLMPKSLLFSAITITIATVIFKRGIKKYEAVGR